MAKKILCLLTALMLAAVCACSNTTENEGGAALYQAGTYTAVAEGRNGEITVEVTFSESKIESVAVTEHSETPSISDAAIEQIPEKIVETQSLAVDAIAGATITSEAILSAVEDAVGQAGGDIEALKTASTDSEGVKEQIEMSADVVVVGAGGAGLLTSQVLSDHGYHVILLEKMAFTGGSTAAAGGGMYIVNSQVQKDQNVQTDPEAFKEVIFEYGHNLNNPALVDIYAENCGSAIDYLQNVQGVELNYFTVNDIYGRFRVNGGGAALAKKLTENVNANENVELLLSCKAEELLYEDGQVIGVKAVGADGSEYTIKATATVLATGGYAFNDEILGDSVPEEAITYGVNYVTGDGLLMAQAIGADAQNLEWVAIKPWGIETQEDYGIYFMNQPTVTSTTGSIVVNNKGVRVVNEEAEETLHKNAYMEQEDHCLYLLMNQNGLDAFKETGSTYTPEQVDEWIASDAATPLFVSGETIEEAAEKAGIDAEALKETIAHYDEMVASGEDTDFHHTVTEPIGDGPYYILQMKMRYCQTLGGLVANENLEILDTLGNPIPGLYGAGEVVGSALGDEALSLFSWAMSSGYYLGETLSEALAK